MWIIHESVDCFVNNLLFLVSLKSKDDFTSSYKIFFLVKNEIIYLMQKNGLVYLIHTYIYKLSHHLKGNCKYLQNLRRIYIIYINNPHLQFHQNIYIRKK